MANLNPYIPEALMRRMMDMQSVTVNGKTLDFLKTDSMSKKASAIIKTVLEGV